MNRRDLVIFLGLEVFSAVWAGVVFSFFSSRLLAGALAGGFFVLSGGYMFFKATRWRERWTSATFYLLALHLWGVSLPMVITRLLNASRPFEQVHIWGLEGPVFHQLSSGVFAGLVLATLIDLVRAGLRARSPKAVTRGPNPG